MIKWSDFKLPPINLWSLPNMVKRFKNDEAFNFETYEDSEIDLETLKDLHKVYDDKVEEEYFKTKEEDNEYSNIYTTDMDGT